MSYEIRQGDCHALMANIEPASVDAIVTDPPYGLAFMGKEWDHGVPGVPFWTEALRVLKPGAHLVAFGGTRTYHRLACAIEDAGFEVRDCLMWLYGSGFPKSLDMSKAIDKALGAVRVKVSGGNGPAYQRSIGNHRPWMDEADHKIDGPEPASDAARQWSGWGTALKPAYEPIIVARKPHALADELAILVPKIEVELCKVATLGKTDTFSSVPLRVSGLWNIASSLPGCLAVLSAHASKLTTGTAFALITDLRILSSSLSRLTRAITTGEPSGINGVESDAWLVAGISRSVFAKCERLTATTAGELAIGAHAEKGSDQEESRLFPAWEPIILARKPLVGTVAANVLEHGTGALNVDGCRIGTSKGVPASPRRAPQGQTYGDLSKDPATGTGWDAHLGRWPANLVLDEEAARMLDEQTGELSSGALNRASITAPNKIFGQRPKELIGTYAPNVGGASRFFFTAKASSGERHYAGKNAHPTVKPVDLMQWLCRLVTPKGGLILDPFMGSGSTGIAALAEGFRFLGLELDAEYCAMARRRIAGPLFAWADAIRD
jgi:DNA modification methylase